jgi:DNA-directed RNA polymerase specialized sigma24 family protein
MSPLLLRRFRAERLLREEFDALRARVLSSVRTRLRASGASIDAVDLEAAYSLAWQGLYAAVLEGEEVGNPAGWLAVVAFRRAIEESRVQGRRGGPSLDQSDDGSRPRAPLHVGVEPDLAAELDDRVRLRELFEGLRGLSERELQAATLCYLQGLTRAEAALLMGISVERMRKLMEGQGPRRPGVAGKVGALVETISQGGWCDAQGSLMRGLAFGMLDPAGERYRLAQLHREECPACRAYVLSLRGLATVLPPLPSLLHLALGAGAAGTVGASGVAGASLGAGPATGTGAGPAAGAATQSGPAIAGTLSASGAAGAGGAAGGGWLLAGGSAKLAMGCLLALTVGAGCVALSGGVAPVHPPDGRRTHLRAVGPAARTASSASPAPSGRLTSTSTGASSARLASSALTPAARASREFGPEQPLAGGTVRSGTGSGAQGVTASAVSSAFEQGAQTGSRATRSASKGSAGDGSSASAADAGANAGSHAEREFGIG